MESDKRESILSAAAAAFGKLGFKKASVDLIARSAGVAKGTVYLCCDNKEDLFYQAVLRELRGWIAEVSRSIDPRVPADELLMRISASNAQYMESRPLVRDLLFGVFHGELPRWAARFEELRDMSHANIVEILELGVRQGVFRDDLDIHVTASILQEMQIGGMLFRHRLGDLEPARLAERRRHGVTIVLDGLRARPPASH